MHNHREQLTIEQMEKRIFLCADMVKKNDRLALHALTNKDDELHDNCVRVSAYYRKAKMKFVRRLEQLKEQ